MKTILLSLGFIVAIAGMSFLAYLQMEEVKLVHEEFGKATDASLQAATDARQANVEASQLALELESAKKALQQDSLRLKDAKEEVEGLREEAISALRKAENQRHRTDDLSVEIVNLQASWAKQLLDLQQKLETAKANLQLSEAARSEGSKAWEKSMADYRSDTDAQLKAKDLEIAAAKKGPLPFEEEKDESEDGEAEKKPNGPE